MDAYTQKIDGIPLTFQLSEEDATKRGLKLQAAPANKARTAKDKADGGAR
ncbi:hypothetical protein [Cryobacterium zongtaii]|nr:hypothetical protein [Cryobacterium zongtaii]